MHRVSTIASVIFAAICFLASFAVVPAYAADITTEADLISALQSGTASTITLGGNITLSTATVSMGESHTIETGNFTLTISGGETYSTGGRIDLGTHTLTLKGNAVIESVQGIRSANGTLNLENVNAMLKIANSIYAGTVNVNSGATVNLNSGRSDGLGGSLLTLQNSTYSLNVNSGGVINIQDAIGAGINNSSSGTININSGGAINIGVIRNENWGIVLQGSGVLKLNSGGTLNGTAGGAIYLGNGTKVNGMNGKFNDRGTALTATGEVTVGAADAIPSANGLSSGLYLWNGSVFVKASVGTITGTMTIGGTSVSDLTQNQTGTGWTWTASTATLALDNTYTGEPIAINCGQSTDNITLVYTGDVSVNSSASSAIFCNGDLEISESGTGGTLTIASTSADALHCAIEVNGSLAISSGTVNAEAAGSGTSPNAAVIYGKRGVTVSGGASLTTNATGSDASGIWVEVGDITISTTGIVTANGNGAGSALVIGNDPHKFSISNGTVNLTGNPMNGFTLTAPVITGGTVNIGGTQVYLATITLPGVSSYTVVTAISAPASGYGVQRMLSDMSGKLYFWLPAGNQIVTLTAGGKTYTGTVNVTTDNAATATLNEAVPVAPPSVPVFHGLADEYTAGSPAVPLKVAGTGSESLTVFKVNGTAATELNPATAGTYRVEAASADGKLRIWKYVKVK
jgi:hypothetical protein